MRLAESKIVARESLRGKLAEHKKQGQRLVFANGCFDTLHVGHVRYLEGARREGDILVVGVNADSSVCATWAEVNCPPAPCAWAIRASVRERTSAPVWWASVTNDLPEAMRFARPWSPAQRTPRGLAGVCGDPRDTDGRSSWCP